MIEEQEMYKRLKILVPAVQVLLVVGVFLWYKAPHSEHVLTQYVGPARDVVIKLNFPLLILWSPILYITEWFPLFLSPSHPATQVLGIAVFALALVSSVAVFWHLVLVELELRSQGRSMIRSSNWFAETCKAVLLVLCGLGALIYAYTEASRLLLLGRSKFDAFGGGLFLVAWSAVLIGTSISDIAYFLRRENRVRS
jgi:hypothetical protein